MVNHLANETSPYLTQHQDNPVAWYPWGEEALSRAKLENKPIFLSIGYAACHWCHVMAHESFEDIETANLLNENLISIKVDREERPDLDDIYMQAVVLLTGQGGWPMSVFLTPDLMPFYGGTYFPPIPKHGLPSFKQILTSVINVWHTNQEGVQNNAQKITAAIQSQHTSMESHASKIDLNAVTDRLYETYNWDSGGWGSSPKFPQPMVIDFLIQRAHQGDQNASDMVEHMLTKMALGGMYDLVGGGFHRYSTDDFWLIPHFEKMLYDNAQLALVYLHAFQLTGNLFFRKITADTLEFIQREMTDPEGGFYSSLDADTPEGEGRYYAWQFEELQSSLSLEQFELLESTTSLTEKGNFEAGFNILQYKASPETLAKEKGMTVSELQKQLDDVYSLMRKLRSTRLHPQKDDKVITTWNALTIRAFIQTGLSLNRKDFLTTGQKGLNFISNKLQTSRHQLNHVWRKGKARHPGTLSDYASLILALHAQYEVSFDPEIYQDMLGYHQVMQTSFASESTLYYDTDFNVTNLIVRPQNTQDNATPSGNALAGHVHWVLGNYRQSTEDFDRLEEMVEKISGQASQYPTGFGYWLSTADLLAHPTQQIVLASLEGLGSLSPFLAFYREKYLPYAIIAIRSKETFSDTRIPPITEAKTPIDNKATAYICENFTCHQPTTEVDIFMKDLGN